MKEIEFFIEGQEHVRFIESYISIVDGLGKNYQIASLEQISFDNPKFNENLIILDKQNLRQYFKNISSSFVITTTPGVGTFYFPKSKFNNTKYIYVFHSLVSPNQVYLKNSFLNFDFILCPNDIIKDQLSTCVKNSTKVLTIGYPVLDYYKNTDDDLQEKTVLFAPSWGDDSFLFNLNFLKKLTNHLSKEFNRFILRPHPMHISKIKNNNLKELDFQIDLNKNLPYLKNVDLLVTDWSGISLEYFYLTEKPVLFIDNEKKIRRKLKKSEKNFELIEDKIRNIIGVKISPNNEQIDFEEYKKLKIKNDINYLDLIYSPKFDFQFSSNLLNSIFD